MIRLIKAIFLLRNREQSKEQLQSTVKVVEQDKIDA